MVGAADDILGDEFPKELPCLILAPFPGELVRMFLGTVFLYVLKDLVIGKDFLPCRSKEHVI